MNALDALRVATLCALVVVSFLVRRAQKNDAVDAPMPLTESTYRNAATPATPASRGTHGSRLEVACVVLGMIAYASGGVLGASSLLIVLVAVAIGMPLRRAFVWWRARRNARLALAWERSFDSADAGEVRARERS